MGDECAQLEYLLGLAYELSGNERYAVNTYWWLWHDYPDTIYAVLAGHKLEMDARQGSRRRPGAMPGSSAV